MACSERSGWARIARTAAIAVLLSGSLVFRAPPARAASEARLGLNPRGADSVAVGAGIHGTLLAEATRARRWRYAWIAINGGLAVGSFALMPFYDREGWPELVVGGIGSTVSTVLTIAWPLDVEGATALTTADAAEMEAARLAYARDERDRLRWPWHVLNVGVGVAYFGILGLGWGHWRSGALAGLTAFAIGELQTITQPAALANAAPAAPPRPANLVVRPSFGGTSGGTLGLVVAGAW